MHAGDKVHKQGDPPAFETPRQTKTSPKQGPTKRTDVLQKILKQNVTCNPRELLFGQRYPFPPCFP